MPTNKDNRDGSPNAYPPPPLARGRRTLAGDLTRVDPCSLATEGSLVVARIGEQTVMRTIDHRGPNTVLRSVHAEDAEIILGPSQDFEIVGVVCGLLRGPAKGFRAVIPPHPWPRKRAQWLIDDFWEFAKMLQGNS